MSWGRTKDMGAYMEPRHAGAEVDALAAGAGDNTEVNGAWIDTRGFESLELFLSFTTTLGADETLSLKALNVQDADAIDGTGAADVSADHLNAITKPIVLATGGAGGTTETGEHATGIDLTMLKRFVRVQWTPDLSAADTDTANISSLYVLGGKKYPEARTGRTILRA